LRKNTVNKAQWRHALCHWRRNLFDYATAGAAHDMLRETISCLKKRPTFTTCYNFYIHSSILTIFGSCRESRQSKCALFSHLT